MRARQLGWVLISVSVVALGALLIVRLFPWGRSDARGAVGQLSAESARFDSPGVTIAAGGAGAVPPAIEARAGRAHGEPGADPQAQLPSGAAASTIRQVGRARGFRDALLRAGCSRAESSMLLAALGKLVDFRRVQPGDDLVFERASGGELVSFEYRASPIDRVRAQRASEHAFRAARVDVKREFRRLEKGGYIRDSLAQALEALGVHNALLGAYVEAFEGRIDFRKHMRAGDSFKLIVDEEYIDGQARGYGKVHALQYQGSQAGKELAFWFEPEAKTGDFYDQSGRGMHGGWLRTPLRYHRLSSRFNLRRRHPILGRIMPHAGIDYAAAAGTTVWAAADGVVKFVGRRGPNGNLVALRHFGGYETYYAHLSRTAPGLRVGMRVRQRQPIGAVGSTGRSTGPHLHFALKRGRRFVDPATQLNGPGKALVQASLARFKRVAAALERELAAIPLAPAPAAAAPAGETDEDFREEAIDL